MLKFQITAYFLFLVISVVGQSYDKLDVVAYQLDLTIDFSQKSIRGTETIDLKVPVNASKIALDKGSLTIHDVQGQGVQSYEEAEDQLLIQLDSFPEEILNIQIGFVGSPNHGLMFEDRLAYTIFSTSQWMVCNMDPSDRAIFELTIQLPDSMQLIGSGIVTTNQTNWSTMKEMPAYTFGFAVGILNQTVVDSLDKRLSYYSETYSKEEIITIFKETPEIIKFLEKTAGIPYPYDTYNQVLAGNYYQEMAGFAMIKESYGQMILEDKTETNLITHELAHQWWGNNVTCQSWSHFWLNEGFATFLSAAYNEHRFGRSKYMKDIESYREVYEKIKARGMDKPLVFPDWTNPSREDRNLVYFKGAYFLHLLRNELGDKAFWDGLKTYTIRNYGKSVISQNFQKIMEETSGQDLKELFDDWVY